MYDKLCTDETPRNWFQIVREARKIVIGEYDLHAFWDSLTFKRDHLMQYFLLRLDFRHGRANQQMFDVSNLLSLTIEHILPQNPDPESDWVRNLFPEEQLRKYCVHKFGNTAIIAGAVNSSLRNRPWVKKKEIYKEIQSGNLTGRLGDLETFDHAAYKTRHKLIVTNIEELLRSNLENIAGDKRTRDGAAKRSTGVPAADVLASVVPAGDVLASVVPAAATETNTAAWLQEFLARGDGAAVRAKSIEKEKLVKELPMLRSYFIDRRKTNPPNFPQRGCKTSLENLIKAEKYLRAESISGSWKSIGRKTATLANSRTNYYVGGYAGIEMQHEAEKAVTSSEVNCIGALTEDTVAEKQNMIVDIDDALHSNGQNTTVVVAENLLK